ncbi:copper chaperone CopZ [Halanaerobium saccharolyticum]|uniref:Copper chaperone CopZ n=1 Tax=Halanaerobium saccharolyticum TaxID=43595 RepID=A0A4R7YTI9_9FIRM|nr:heavy-metal-associated domain-containing protein [Halanaerobium saccharolyticum]TDW00935.1 copper chaperone CopZ [Halanaerobium saccharolyticum]TDX52575.1 copper chaperone CopZ [Halanaerobium saccharolyticum]
MKKTIIIEGMSCEHCEMHTKEELEKIDGIVFVTVDAEKGEAVVELEKEVTEFKLKVVLKKLIISILQLYKVKNFNLNIHNRGIIFKLGR